MKSTLAIELIANAGKLISEINRSGGAVSRFSAGARNQIAAIGRAAGSIQGQLAGLGITVGVLALGKQSAQLEKEITRVGQTASASKDQVSGLKKELFAMAKQSGGEVEGLKSGFDALVQSGLSWKAALESTRGINIAKGVTGAQESVLASGLSVGATAFQIDLEKPGKALELLDKMTVAGRLGNAELENLSDVFARVGANAAASGMKFESTLGFVEALSLLEKNPERLATLVDSTLRVFTNNNYMKAAQKATGIKFFDAKGARRDATDILKDIKKVYDTLKTDEQRNNFVSKAFGGADQDTVKGLRTLLTGGNLANIDIFTNKIKEAGGTLNRDFDEATKNLIDQAVRLKSTLRQAADGFAAPIGNTLAEFMKFSMDSKDKGGLGMGAGEMAAGGGAILAGGLIASKLGSKLAGKWLGNAGGVATGKALEAATGVTPVYVTNMSDAAGLGGPGVAVNPVAAAGATGLRATIAGAVTSIGLGSLTTAVGAASVAAVGGVIAAGGLAGYGIGTGINKAIDDTAYGDLIGEGLNRIAAYLGNEESRRALAAKERSIEINMAISDGRVVTTSNDAKTKVNAKANRGDFKK